MGDFLRRGESPAGQPKDPLTRRESEIVKLMRDEYPPFRLGR